MRIIGGKHRGRKLLSPKGETRPSTGKLREALFNIVDVQGARVWDLFAGSGSIGLEALSRGAAFVLFVERRASILRRNIALCDEEERSQVIEGNALHLPEGEADLIFADPPYDLEVRQQLLERCANHLAQNGRLFIEEESGRAAVEGPLELKKVRRYGRTQLLEYGHASTFSGEV